MSRTSKTKPTQDTISIKDAIAKLKTNEQTLRLALMEFRPDDFDTIKSLSTADYDAVASKLTKKELPTEVEDTESPPTTALQSENTPIGELARQHHQQEIESYPQSPIPNQIALVEQLTRQASEQIQLTDAIAQATNQIIINNLNVRQQELQEHLNQHWQGQKAGYLGVLTSLVSLAQDRPEITQDNTDVNVEIEQIMGELGKKLVC